MRRESRPREVVLTSLMRATPRMEWSVISEERIAEWVSESYEQLTLASFAQSDLDEFTQAGDVPADAARVAVDCFVAVVDRTALSALDVDLMVFIPLPWSDTMTAEHPTLDEVLQQRWTEVEIPGLYMMRPNLSRTHHAVEEYQAPLRTHIQARRPVVGFYRTFLHDANNGSTPEWSRGLYLRTDGPCQSARGNHLSP